MFYGIVIYMYFFDDERHKLPHVHARYQGQEASFSINDGSILSGDFPVAKGRLVQAWIEIHRDALLADWEPGHLDIAPETLYDRSMPA